MAISDEAVVIKQYQPLIRALIPYQQQNKLLEGLNKFSARLPSNVRNIIKEEVIRLTSVTDAAADNSAFAQFPVMKFKHFGINMRLDKVGKDILDKETSFYDDRYTVGVFESIMNSDHYQNVIKQEQQKKIVDAFTVQAQTFEDIDFGADLAIRPNFTVFCAEFENGRNCVVESLSPQGMVLETKRTPVIETESSRFVFTFPEVPGLTSKGTQIVYEMENQQFNKDLNRFETAFSLSAKTPPKLLKRIQDYVKRVMHQLPLQRDLEIERAMQDLERDRILANSPWFPIFLESRKDALVPTMALMTKVNLEYNDSYATMEQLPNKVIFDKLMTELTRFDETFLLKGTFQTPNGPITVAVTHRELAARKMLKQFITMIMESEDFSVIQCRLMPIANRDKLVSYDIHDIISSDYPELDELTHVLFCKNVTDWVGKLDVSKPEPRKPFPKSIIDSGDYWSIDVVMEQDLDRRSEPRFVMEKAAVIKSGLFTSYEATLNDLSLSGLKMTVHQPKEAKLDGDVKVTVPELKLKGEKYDIIDFDKSTGVLRLKVSDAKNAKTGDRINAVMDKNTTYFKQRNITKRQRNIHRYLWELSIRYVPSVAVMITRNRHPLDRLKGIYVHEESTDLEPFTSVNHEVPLHGFFADKEETTPKSTLLQEMLSKSNADVHVIHAVRHKDKRIIFVKEQEFLYGDLRDQISNFVAKKAIQACVAHINAIGCSSPDTSLTKKRLAQLSKIDIDTYEKLKGLQKAYTHVLYITDVSAFHNALLKFGIYPVEETEEAEQQA